MKIGILCTGDEILTGKTVNTNYAHIAKRLVEFGFEVNWGAIVGDHHQSLHQAMETASGSSDAVIVNGGLGPTLDDLTQQVAADVAKVELALHQEWLDHIRSWYRARGRNMPDNNLKQALLPEGCELIDNPIGTACGFALDILQTRFFFTPGVPRELYTMLDQQIIPRLQRLRGVSLYSCIKRFHSFGIGESRADKLLAKAAQMADARDIKLGFQSHYPQLETKLVLTTKNQTNTQLTKPVENEIRSCLGNFIVCEGDETLEGNICRMLENAGTSVSVVEMDTCGIINSRLLCAIGHSHVVKAGFVARTQGEICQFLALQADDSALPMLAEQVAAEASRKHSSTYGLAVLTAQYIGEDDQRGLEIHLAIAAGGSTKYRISKLPGSLEWTRIGAVELGLDFLRRFLVGLPVDELIDFEQH